MCTLFWFSLIYSGAAESDDPEGKGSVGDVSEAESHQALKGIPSNMTVGPNCLPAETWKVVWGESIR